MEDAKLNLDLDRLATHLRTKMEEDDLSIRSAAEKIGCSAATLARLLRRFFRGWGAAPNFW